MKTRTKRMFIELALWVLANVLCMGLATGAAYIAGSSLLGWGPTKLGIFIPLVAILSSTWGSWSSMVWARSRPLRIGMYGSAAIPGIVMLALGLFGLIYIKIGSILVWGAVIVGGIGMLAATVTLCRLFNPRTHNVPGLSKFYGVLVHPLLTLASTGAVATLWYIFVSRPPSGWRDLVSVSVLMMTMLAAALISTVLPAAMSTLCRKLAYENGEKMNRR